MNDEGIRKAWHELHELFGPDYYGRNSALKNKAQVYAKLVLEANDTDRIKVIGKRHLQLVADKLLEGKQFDQFLYHVFLYERFL